MNLLTITFDQAYREIARRTFVTKLEDISERMALMRKMAKIVGVYRVAKSKEPHLGIDGDHFRIPNIWELRRQGDSVANCPPFDQLCEEITSWLMGKFPMLEDPTFAQWTDNSDDNTLMFVVNPGIDMGWDEAAELFEDPENFSQEYGLMFLAVYVVFFREFIAEDQDMKSFWAPASEWFGWGVELPWWLWLPDNLWATDNKKLYRLLDKAGLPNVADMFRMVWHDTGMFFLDLENPYDSYYGQDDSVQDFTVENIERLSRLWDEAQPIHDRGYQAVHEACLRPDMYKTIVELLGRCIVPRGKKLTLKELKAAAAENKRLATKHPEGDEEENDESK
jgi:hypothetical protein